MQIIKQPWALSIPEVLDQLKTQEAGITDSEASERLNKYGKNIFHGKGKTNPVLLFLKQFLSPLIFILICSACLTMLLKEWLDMWVVLSVVILNVALGFFHEYNAENTLDKLKTYIKDRTRVIRAGT